MCRSIKPLFNYDPPTTKEEIREASRQYVRKVSGFRIPAKVNMVQFETAINEVTLSTEKLLATLVATSRKPHNREIEIRRKKQRSDENLNRLNR